MNRDMTKPTKWLCAQLRLRSAWASAQSDQSLRCAFNGWLRTQAFFTRTAKTLIKLGACPGWPESSLGAQPLCWFCHVAVHFCFTDQKSFKICCNFIQGTERHRQMFTLSENGVEIWHFACRDYTWKSSSFKLGIAFTVIKNSLSYTKQDAGPSLQNNFWLKCFVSLI